MFIVHQTKDETIFMDFYQYYLELILNYYTIFTRTCLFDVYTDRETSI